MRLIRDQWEALKARHREAADEFNTAKASICARADNPAGARYPSPSALRRTESALEELYHATVALDAFEALHPEFRSPHKRLRADE